MARPRGSIRPQAWLSGPDPKTHEKFIPWHRARCQARFRNEEFLLTFEEFCEFWTDENWARRGRTRDSLAMRRIDPDGAWSKDNCEIVNRSEQVSEANRRRHELRREHNVKGSNH